MTEDEMTFCLYLVMILACCLFTYFMALLQVGSRVAEYRDQIERLKAFNKQLAEDQMRLRQELQKILNAIADGETWKLEL